MSPFLFPLLGQKSHQPVISIRLNIFSISLFCLYLLIFEEKHKHSLFCGQKIILQVANSVGSEWWGALLGRNICLQLWLKMAEAAQKHTLPLFVKHFSRKDIFVQCLHAIFVWRDAKQTLIVYTLQYMVSGVDISEWNMKHECLVSSGYGQRWESYGSRVCQRWSRIPLTIHPHPFLWTPSSSLSLSQNSLSHI